MKLSQESNVIPFPNCRGRGETRARQSHGEENGKNATQNNNDNFEAVVSNFHKRLAENVSEAEHLAGLHVVSPEMEIAEWDINPALADIPMSDLAAYLSNSLTADVESLHHDATVPVVDRHLDRGTMSATSENGFCNLEGSLELPIQWSDSTLKRVEMRDSSPRTGQNGWGSLSQISSSGFENVEDVNSNFMDFRSGLLDFTNTKGTELEVQKFIQGPQLLSNTSVQLRSNTGQPGFRLLLVQMSSNQNPSSPGDEDQTEAALADATEMHLELQHVAESEISVAPTVADVLPRMSPSEQIVANIAKAIDGVGVAAATAPVRQDLRIKLYPEHLGEVEVKLEITGDRLRVQIISSRQEAVEMLREIQNDLAHSARELGAVLEQAEVIFAPQANLNDKANPLEISASVDIGQAGLNSSQRERNPSGAFNGQPRDAKDAVGKERINPDVSREKVDSVPRRGVFV